MLLGLRADQAEQEDATEPVRSSQLAKNAVRGWTRRVYPIQSRKQYPVQSRMQAANAPF